MVKFRPRLSVNPASSLGNGPCYEQAHSSMDDKKFVALLPENLQLKILSLVTSGEEGAVAPAPPSAPVAPAPQHALASATDEDAAALAGLHARLRSHGFGWEDDFVPPDVAAALLAAAQGQQPALTPAGMSSSVAKWRDPTARGDLTTWLPFEGEPSAQHAPLCGSPAWAQLRRRLQLLVATLNAVAEQEGRELVALPEKAMLAHYPIGARYVRHSDVSPAVAHRRLTAILYLNSGWEEGRCGRRKARPASLATAPPVALPGGCLGPGRCCAPRARPLQLRGWARPRDPAWWWWGGAVATDERLPCPWGTAGTAASSRSSGPRRRRRWWRRCWAGCSSSAPRLSTRCASRTRRGGR